MSDRKDQPVRDTRSLIQEALAKRATQTNDRGAGRTASPVTQIGSTVEASVRSDLVKLYRAGGQDPAMKTAMATKLATDNDYARQLHRVDPKLFAGLSSVSQREAISNAVLWDGPAARDLHRHDPYRAGKIASNLPAAPAQTNQVGQADTVKKSRSL